MEHIDPRHIIELLERWRKEHPECKELQDMIREIAVTEDELREKTRIRRNTSRARPPLILSQQVVYAFFLACPGAPWKAFVDALPGRPSLRGNYYKMLVKLTKSEYLECKAGSCKPVLGDADERLTVYLLKLYVKFFGKVVEIWEKHRRR